MDEQVKSSWLYRYLIPRYRKGQDPDSETFEADETVLKALTLISLSETYDYARSSCIHYRRYGVEKIHSFEVFEEIPILGRSNINSAIISASRPNSEIDRYIATSSTATGVSLFIPRSFSETEALKTYINQVKSRRSDIDGVLLRLLPSGRLVNPGNMSHEPQVLACYEINGARDGYFDIWCYIVGQLFASFPGAAGEKRIEAIHATPPFGLELLTKYMTERGVSPKDTAIKWLAVTGGWMGRKTRKRLEQTWNASLTTTYSCAEMNGWVQECPQKVGRYHFNATIYPEVVPLTSSKGVLPGEQGRLILTGIYPFHQTANIIRYDVGDWVRWIGHCRCECGIFARTVEFLGRKSAVTFVETSGGSVLPLPSVPVFEALDGHSAFPGVPTYRYFFEIRKESRIPVVILHAECFAVGDGKWKKRLAGKLIDTIKLEYPEFSVALESGLIEAEVQFHGRGMI